MKIKRKKAFVNPDDGRKELFHFMSRTKYPKVDQMMLQLARKQTHYPPALNNDNPIHYIMPAIPIQTIAEPSIVGAYQQTSDQGHHESEGVEESKEEVAEELATATVAPGYEGIKVNAKGELFNPKTGHWVQDIAATRARLIKQQQENIKKTPKKPNQPKPTSPEGVKEQRREKRK